MLGVYFNLESSNEKTGPIPVSTTSEETCPDACPLKDANVCYAKSGPLAYLWNTVSNATPGKITYNSRGYAFDILNWNQFCDKVEALPEETFWRHNQAGDLPGPRDRIDVPKVKKLVKANKGKKGFTYSHKPITGKYGDKNAEAIKFANENGFTVNLSADTLEEADQFINTKIGPVVVVLPHTVHGNQKITTPEGNVVVVCPATYRDDVSCKDCQLCAVKTRKTIVGFPAHGPAKKRVLITVNGKSAQ